MYKPNLAALSFRVFQHSANDLLIDCSSSTRLELCVSVCSQQAEE